MLDKLFSGLFQTAGITPGNFAIAISAALVLGALLAGSYMFRSRYTGSFVITLAILPAAVAVVIMMVSGNLGAGVAVAGTFSLVRFRSVPGSAREIGAVFLAMAIGLACGMGYPGFAAAFTAIMGPVLMLYTCLSHRADTAALRYKALQVTVPEDLDYGGIFDDLFAQFTTQARLIRVKTVNLGSLNKLTYDIVLKAPELEKPLIDAIRCRNGNLEVSCSLRETETLSL